MLRLKSAAIAIGLFCALSLLASPAFAGVFGEEGTAQAGETSTGVSVGVQAASSTAGAGVSTGGGGVGSAPQCVLEAAPASEQALLGQPAGETPGLWYYLVCGTATVPVVPSFFPNGPAGPPPPAVTPSSVAQTALASAAIPAPSIGTNPDTHHLLVNYPTRLFLQGGWAPVSATATVGTVSATATATPYKVVWAMGDGSVITCDSPGSAYNPNESWASQNPPPCGYTYANSSADQPGEAYQLTATVYYHVAWTAGALGGGAMADISRSQTVPAYVGEVQTLEN